MAYVPKFLHTPGVLGLEVNGLVYDIYKNGMSLIYVSELYNLLC